MLSILDSRFKYVPSTATDIRKTFARVRREQEKARREAQRGRLREAMPVDARRLAK
jgi:hypothetical protein